jgi:hypothetical protein
MIRLLKRLDDIAKPMQPATTMIYPPFARLYKAERKFLDAQLSTGSRASFNPRLCEAPKPSLKRFCTNQQPLRGFVRTLP